LSTDPGIAGGLWVPAGAPPGFVAHFHRYAFSMPYPGEQVWGWLNDPATFTEGQVWPFRVEFVDGGFEPGVLNAHQGPFLNLAGVIGEVRGFERGVAYRDLKYFYGSYAISPRLVRPTRLQFWAEESANRTLVTLQVDSLVRRPFGRAWSLSQRVFWSRFPRWMASALGDPGARA
jgi:hypothetical protein